MDDEKIRREFGFKPTKKLGNALYSSDLGKIIDMKLKVESLSVNFFINGNDYGKIINIKKQKYAVFICMCCQNTKRKISFIE